MNKAPPSAKPIDIFKWRFANAEYDCVLAQLSVAGQRRELDSHVAALLECLVREAGEIVAKEKLMLAGWHGATVSDLALNQAMQQLQHTLDDHDGRLITAFANGACRLNAEVIPLFDDLRSVAGSHKTTTIRVGAIKRYVALCLASLSLVAVLWLAKVYLPLSLPTATTHATHATIAVLPFQTSGVDEEQRFVAEGLAEELLNQLTRVPGLQVIGRTSSFTFNQKDTDFASIAQQLGASHLAAGSLQLQGEIFQLSMRLIRAADGTVLWAKTFDARQHELLAVQSEMFSAIRQALNAPPVDDQSARETVHPEAYAFYLRAKQLARVGSEKAYVKAIENYQQALQIDAHYLAAMAGLAGAYRRQAEITQVPVNEGYQRARHMAELALAINPDHASALAELAWVEFNYDHELDKAAQHFQRAVQLNTGNLNFIGNAAVMLHDLGHNDDAIRLSEYVAKYDPLNSRAHANLGLNYLSAGRLDDALAHFHTAVTLSPKRIITHYNIGVVLLLKGEYDAALNEMKRETSDNFRLIGLSLAYQALGLNQEADEALKQLITQYEKDSAFNIAYILAWRGDNDKAFVWLNKAVEYRDPGLSEILVEPLLDKLQRDPRWLIFLRSIDRDPERLAAIKFDVVLPSEQ